VLAKSGEAFGFVEPAVDCSDYGLFRGNACREDRGEQIIAIDRRTGLAAPDRGAAATAAAFASVRRLGPARRIGGIGRCAGDAVRLTAVSAKRSRAWESAPALRTLERPSGARCCPQGRSHLAEAATDASERHRRGQQAANAAHRHYGWPAIAARITDIYREVIARTAAGGRLGVAERA